MYLLIRWREVKEMPAPASLISSPYDSEARYSKKRETTWVGYKVHLTETCDPETPHLNTETTLATVPDDNMLKTVHESLKDHDLLPAEHLVDKGYTDARVLADNPRDYGVTIVGPVADDPAGRRDLARVLTNQRSQSIGTGKLSPARRIGKVSRGYQTPIRRTVLCSRQDFPPRIVRLVRCGPSAPKPSESPASLDCNRVSIMRRCKPPDSIKRRKISNKATPHAQALRNT